MSVSWWKLDRGHKFKLVALMRCREIQLELRRRMKISCGFGQMPNPKFPSASTRGRSTRSCGNCKSIKNEPPEIASRCSEPFQSCMKEVLCFGDYCTATRISRANVELIGAGDRFPGRDRSFTDSRQLASDGNPEVKGSKTV